MDTPPAVSWCDVDQSRLSPAQGEVLVVDTQKSTRTVGGELFATESARRGAWSLHQLWLTHCDDLHMGPARA
jgi:hypothetical protein